MAKSRDRQASRLPFKDRALRIPGESLVRQQDEVMQDLDGWLLVAALLVGMAAVQWIDRWTGYHMNPWILTVASIPGVAYVCFRFQRTLRQVKNLQTGIEGERLVGQALGDLVDAGYKIINDLPGDGFNVDHVAVGPAGVFVIETKTRRKPSGRCEIQYDGVEIRVNGHTPDRDALKQVRACADFVREAITSRTSLKPVVQAVVVYPGWYVPEPPKRPAVWVLNEKRMLGYIRNAPPQLSEKDVDAIAAALAHHVRTTEAA